MKLPTTEVEAETKTIYLPLQTSKIAAVKTINNRNSNNNNKNHRYNTTNNNDMATGRSVVNIQRRKENEEKTLTLSSWREEKKIGLVVPLLKSNMI